MINIINKLSDKKIRINICIPYGKAILSIIPAFLLLLLYRIVLLILNEYYPNLVINMRHIIRSELGIMYQDTLGTYFVAFIFFFILTLGLISFFNSNNNNSSRRNYNKLSVL